MKIEKVNDHQIRCTLTRQDLAERELKISELAYGSEKAKNLFRDMMQQASFEFGFEADDIPLMIEAIPISAESIVLIITKVEDPDELDTRFSKFAPSVHESSHDLDEMIEDITSHTDELAELFRKVLESKHRQENSAEDTSETQAAEAPAQKSKRSRSTQTVAEEVKKNMVTAFSFDSIHTLLKICKLASSFYQGSNSLFKNETTGRYILIVSQGDQPTAAFGRLCNLLCEYGTAEKYALSREAWLEEHCSLLIRDTALQSLSEI